MKKRRPARRATTAAASQKKGQRGSHGGRSPLRRTNYYESAVQQAMKNLKTSIQKALDGHPVVTIHVPDLAEMLYPEAPVFQGPFHPPPADLLDYLDDPLDHQNCRCTVEPEPILDARTAIIDIVALPDHPLLETPHDNG